MGNESTLQTIIKISRENYEILINGGTVGGYTYDPQAMYLVKDGITYITDEEIEDAWRDGEVSGMYIKNGVLYNSDEIGRNVVYVTIDKPISNNTMYI